MAVRRSPRRKAVASRGSARLSSSALPLPLDTIGGRRPRGRFPYGRRVGAARRGAARRGAAGDSPEDGDYNGSEVESTSSGSAGEALTATRPAHLPQSRRFMMKTKAHTENEQDPSTEQGRSDGFLDSDVMQAVYALHKRNRLFTAEQLHEAYQRWMRLGRSFAEPVLPTLVPRDGWSQDDFLRAEDRLKKEPEFVRLSRLRESHDLSEDDYEQIVMAWQRSAPTAREDAAERRAKMTEKYGPLPPRPRLLLHHGLLHEHGDKVADDVRAWQELLGDGNDLTLSQLDRLPALPPLPDLAVDKPRFPGADALRLDKDVICGDETAEYRQTVESQLHAKTFASDMRLASTAHMHFLSSAVVKGDHLPADYFLSLNRLASEGQALDDWAEEEANARVPAFVIYEDPAIREHATPDLPDQSIMRRTGGAMYDRPPPPPTMPSPSPDDVAESPSPSPSPSPPPFGRTRSDTPSDSPSDPPTLVPFAPLEHNAVSGAASSSSAKVPFAGRGRVGQVRPPTPYYASGTESDGSGSGCGSGSDESRKRHGDDLDLVRPPPPLRHLRHYWRDRDGPETRGSYVPGGTDDVWW